MFHIGIIRQRNGGSSGNGASVETPTSTPLKKSRQTAVIMATIFTLAFLTVLVLLDNIFGSLVFKDVPTTWAVLFVIALGVATFYQLIVPLDESHYGLEGIVGWVVIGSMYAVLFRIIIVLVQNPFTLGVVSLVAFGLVRQFIFKLFSLAKRQEPKL